MKILFILFMLINIIQAVPTQNHIATIEKISGKVKVLKSDELRALKASLHQKLYKGDLLITYRKSMTTIKLDDNSFVTLGHKTKLRIQDLKKLKQESGIVFFNIETQGKNKIEIATNFATIGVKGTKFIISDTNKKKSVSLKSGLIGVSALEGEFEIHKTKVKKLSEYEKYKLAQNYAFEQYKEKIHNEFIEYKKEFDLHENRMISFNKNVVNEKNLDKNSKKEFKKFELFQK